MPSPPAASINVSDHLKPDAIALLDRVKALAARMQHPAAGPLHLLAELLEDDATRMAAKRNGGAPEAALARCRDELGKLPTGTVTSAMLPSLARITREAGCYGGGLSGLTLAAKNGAPANVRALFRLALDPPTDGATETIATREPRRGEDRTEGAPEARERQAGPLPVSAGMRATLESIYAAQETPPPANDLPLWTVQYVERELGTTLPDDFWVAIAHANKVLAEQGVGQTMPHGDPAMPDEVAEVVLGVATEASVHVPAGYVAFVSRDPDAAADHLLCVRSGVTFEERNRQPVFPFVDGELGNPLSFAAWVQGDEPLGCRPATWPPIAVPYLIGASAAEQRSGARRVRHAKFGPGVVIRAFDDGDDAKLEILFDRGETKTLIAKFVSDEPPIRARPR